MRVVVGVVVAVVVGCGGDGPPVSYPCPAPYPNGTDQSSDGLEFLISIEQDTHIGPLAYRFDVFASTTSGIYIEGINYVGGSDGESCSESAPPINLPPHTMLETENVTLEIGAICITQVNSVTCSDFGPYRSDVPASPTQ